MKSPVYVCMVIGAVLHMSSVLGPVAFKSKYIEAQFGIPLWKANLLICKYTLFTGTCNYYFDKNIHERMPKGQSIMDNPDKLAS